MKEYSIREFSRRCGISTDRLRHYETMGLLHPIRDAQNQYRYYTDTHLLDIISICIMQSLDIPLKDLCSPDFGISPETTLSRIRICKSSIEQQIELLQNKLYRLSVMERIYSGFPENLPFLEDLTFKPMYVLYYDDPQASSAHHTLISNWMKYMPYVVSFFSINPLDLIGDDTSPVPIQLGLQIVQTYAEHLPIHLDPPVKYLEASSGIRYMLAISDPLHPCIGDFRPLLDYMKTTNQKPTGLLRCSVRGTQQINQKKHYLIRVLLPTKQEN